MDGADAVNRAAQAWAFGTESAGKGGDAYGHYVCTMIRESDDRAKHTSAMLGVPLSGRDDHEARSTITWGQAYAR
jgi:hypothetical protein